MFPFRYTSLFKSRWIALMWAAGICWTAADVAGHFKKPDAPGNASDAPADVGNDTEAAVKQLLG